MGTFPISWKTGTHLLQVRPRFRSVRFRRMAGTPLKLIVGLGNPGAEYARTRHNAGFWLVDEVARRFGGTFRHEGKHQGELARVRIGGDEVWLLKPMTFMNRSGGPVSSVLNFYKVGARDMLVAHDEIDLPSGVSIPALAHGKNRPVVSIHSPRAEEPEAVAAVAEVAPTAAAAPAADAKAGDAKGAPAADAKGAAAAPAKKEGGKK